MSSHRLIPLKKFELFVRNRMPGFVRKPLRLAKLLLSHRESSRPLPAELVDGCRVCASRHDLIGRLPGGGRIAEIGTYKGAFAKCILSTCSPSELHLVDLDFALLDEEVGADSRVSVHPGLSHDVLSAFDEAYFDWIYVDADHSYSGVARDARTAMSKVKPGGHLVFNDFAHMDPFFGAYGVHRAVVDFAIANQWRFAWFAYERNGLYDVALQRPERR